VVKALYAADAGCNLQIEMIRLGEIGLPASLRLRDDPTLPSAWNPGQAGLTQGEFDVRILEFCESEPALPIVGSESPTFHQRFFHFRSEAERTIGGLAGLTRAAVEVDVSAWPFPEEEFAGGVPFCF
jgi:hypothetical protein